MLRDFAMKIGYRNNNVRLDQSNIIQETYSVK